MRRAWLVLPVALLGCSGEDGGSPSADEVDGGMIDDAPATGDPSDGTSSGGPDVGSTESGGTGSDATDVPCARALDHTDLATGAALGPMYGASTSKGELVVAWSNGTQVHVRRGGADATVTGSGVHGLAVTDAATALLVARPSDEMWFVRLDPSGKELASKRLTGASDHTMVGSEWYDYQELFFADGGRLAWNGTQYVAYFPIFRHWPDGISHTGDTLRFLSETGDAAKGGWGWGCSHSLDVRLGEGPTVAPICLSDCYSKKAILFSNSKVLSDEPSGNCGGLSDASLGGFVAVPDGFFLSFVSKQGRASHDIGLVKIATSGAPGEKTWLTADAAEQSAAHLARYEDGLLAAWMDGTKVMLQRLDATGKPKAAAEPIDAQLRAKDDFFGYPSGDVGWLAPSATGIRAYRYRACAK